MKTTCANQSAIHQIAKSVINRLLYTQVCYTPVIDTKHMENMCSALKVLTASLGNLNSHEKLEKSYKATCNHYTEMT